MIIDKTKSSRLASFDPDNFTFGTSFGDHMLVCEYENGAWGEPRILPYGPLPFTPANMAFNYGQACFEGMKAYKNENGEVYLFRPDKNFTRINKSAKRLAMPEVPEDIFMNGLQTLIDMDRDWIPTGEGKSLYIRPIIFATEETLKARISTKFMFAIVTSPAQLYYSEPVAVKISDYYSRSAEGGVGSAKAAGNYAGSFYPTKLANEEGFDQLIWTDDATHTKFEESGTMNVFVRINNTIMTPKTSEKILDGVTRDSFLKLAENRGYEVVVGDVLVEDVLSAARNGTLKEAWGVGTAVVTTSFKLIAYKEEKFDLPILTEEESFALTLKKDLVNIQTGRTEDIFGWRVLVEARNS